MATNKKNLNNNISRQAALTVLSIVGLLIIGALASRVGGIAIRSASVDSNSLSLVFSQPAVRGVLTSVRWTISEIETDQDISFFMRHIAGEELVGQAVILDGEARILLPCSSVDNIGTLIVRNTQSNIVLASSPVELFPPGRECVLR